MKLQILCAALALTATVLTSGCSTTSRRYANPPTVVGYAPAAAPAPCCNGVQAPPGTVLSAPPGTVPPPNCGR